MSRAGTSAVHQENPYRSQQSMDRLKDCSHGETAIRPTKAVPGKISGALSQPWATDGNRSFPSFFIVGPPRTGTSWLHDVLSGYVLLPEPTKETRFFDVHFPRGPDWYLSHYPACGNDKPIGEVAPTYFASAIARERIRRTIPNARVVCIFRNPLQRVLSLYRLKRAYGMIPWSFEQAIVHDPELKASGMYATNLKAWRTAFSPEQVLATVYDDLRDNPQCYLNTVLEFIGAPPILLTQSQIRRVHGSEAMTHPRNYYWTRNATLMAEWFKARRFDGLVASIRRSPLRRLFLGGGAAFNELSIEVSSAVCELFRPEIEELESILNRDFSSWKSVKA